MTLTISEKLFLLISKQSTSSNVYHSNTPMLESYLVDLLYHGVIGIENDQIEIQKQLPKSLDNLDELDEYLKQHVQNQRRMNALVFNVIKQTKMAKSIYEKIGEKLATDGIVADQGHRGWIIKYHNFTPKPTIINQLINQIKSEMIDSSEKLNHSTLFLSKMLIDSSYAMRYFNFRQIKTMKQQIKTFQINHHEYDDIFELMKVVQNINKAFRNSNSAAIMVASTLHFH
ncbi:hypothetical protein WR164_05170 [Philodulcilactobacillus myokoensis]|uniref:GPP34 family phosphoprotein n=1 Tax=Philodulcilactobacillus myokoensis TaxID=2929573 RepID=A0A9W6ESN8_9LACO|nr:hypothetical protein [Philodulcilactobacillus myokoensis]GLB46538.1 hypothetical protein WR164_05170 [Philodulcilactobacillus myokoensis]